MTSNNNQQQLPEAINQQTNNVNIERNKELTSFWFEDLDVDVNNQDEESLGFLDYHLSIEDEHHEKMEMLNKASGSPISHANKDQTNHATTGFMFEDTYKVNLYSNNKK